MNPKISIDLIKHRIEQSKDDLESSKLLFREAHYKSANSRAYYAIFHALRSVLATEPIDFKRHKDVIAYFNKNYVNKELFPKQMGRRIARASQVREDSDYDDEFVVDKEVTLLQIETAEELIKLVEKYVEEKISEMK